MKEIKFRAWDIKENKYWFFNLKDLWREGCEQQLLELNDSKQLGQSSRFPYFDCVIEQYTGLKDKNGEEIYEGDIVKFRASGYFFGGERKGIDEIVWGLWSDGEYADTHCWLLKNTKYPAQSSEMEIIGNAHENPELLENQDDG